MRFSTAVAASAAFVAGANAWGNYTGPVYTTEVVTAYTTYCPEATEITHGGVTYTVTEATTLTITDCPCTIVKPVTTSSIPTSAPVYANSTSAATKATTASGTVSVATSAGTSATASSSPITASSGNKAATLSGAALAGLVGLAAFVL